MRHHRASATSIPAENGRFLTPRLALIRAVSRSGGTPAPRLGDEIIAKRARRAGCIMRAGVEIDPHAAHAALLELRAFSMVGHIDILLDCLVGGRTVSAEGIGCGRVPGGMWASNLRQMLRWPGSRRRGQVSGRKAQRPIHGLRDVVRYFAAQRPVRRHARMAIANPTIIAG